jgi:hypothetical protein
MTGISIVFQVLEAVITLAVLISVSGLLVFFTSNRMGRTGDRVRALTAEAERLQISASNVPATGDLNEIKRKHIAQQLNQLSDGALLLRSALTALFTAIAFLVAGSILAGVVALLQWAYTWLPIVAGFAGSCALLYGIVLLVREARLSTRSTLEDVASAREAAIDREEQRIETEAAWDWFRRAWSHLRCSADSRVTRLEKTRRKNGALFYVTQAGESAPCKQNLPTHRHVA